MIAEISTEDRRSAAETSVDSKGLGGAVARTTATRQNGARVIEQGSERAPIPTRRTKIVATIGPATDGRERMTDLIRAGADVLRLNFSHGQRSWHEQVIKTARQVAADLGREVALLGDLPGPKLRIEDIAGGGVELAAGEDVRITASIADGRGQLQTSWAGLVDAVQEGDEIFLADGRVRLTVLETGDSGVRCRVESGGSVLSRQGMNLPGLGPELPAAGEGDLRWVDFAVAHGVDLLAVSFVRSAKDLLAVQRHLEDQKSDIPLIAKIEKPQAVEFAQEIVAASTGGIMVARGDLGIELPVELVPTTQKRLLALAGHYSKPSITATQMLASMVMAPRPTRAEVSDIANAIYQGTDAVMLSEETAIGQHPVEAVRVMDRIARATEADLPYRDWAARRAATDPTDVASSVARAAVASTHNLGLKAIVVPTRSGRTARLVSAHRPAVPVLAISPRLETARRLQGIFGVSALHHDEPSELHELLHDCAVVASEVGLVAPGDLVGVIAGLPSQQLGTNVFEVHRVPD